MTGRDDDRDRKGGRADFWSRRRAAVRQAEERARAERVLREDAGKAAALEERTDREILEELGLPDPDGLGEGADFKPFLRTVVPERIRRRALRRLWSLNPVLANLDGLVEYGEDFTDAATVVDGLQTAYQVGKGMLRHLEEMDRQAGQPDPGGLTAAVRGGEASGDGEAQGSRPPGSPVNATAAGGPAGAPGGETGAIAGPEPGDGSVDVALQHPAGAGMAALTPATVPQDTSDCRTQFGDAVPLRTDVERDAEAPAQSPEFAGPIRRRMRFS